MIEKILINIVTRITKNLQFIENLKTKTKITLLIIIFIVFSIGWILLLFNMLYKIFELLINN
jgi:hypothetical protein